MFLDGYKVDKKTEKEELKLDSSIKFWKNFLFEKIVRVFEWEGLPFPQREIEMRLIMEGFCGVVKDGKKGIMCASGGMSGPTEYFDVYKYFTYARPTAEGGRKTIVKDCVKDKNSD